MVPMWLVLTLAMASADPGFQLHSDQLREGTVPPGLTCDGEGAEPTLSWEGAPEGTKSFAVLVTDKYLPSHDYTHWILWNITGVRWIAPLNSTSFATGMNSDGKVGWTPICPPAGDPAHRYVFRVYALDTKLELMAGAMRPELLQAMEGHVLAEDKVVATYKRRRFPSG